MINVGVIGTGTWGKNHVRVFSELESTNLKKIADLNESNLNNLNITYKVTTTINYKDILEDKEIDAISICTPASTHFKLVKEALEAGKHVLVEKPLTLKSEEGEELIRLAKEKDKILMVGHIFRFNPGVLKLKEEIKKGTFGNINFMYGSRMGLMTPRDDCGVTYDFALHDIDTFCFILDDLPIEVMAIGESYIKDGFDDVCFITLKFKNNIIANIGVSWLTPKKVRDLWLVGKDKCAKLDYLSQELEIFDKGIIPQYDSFGSFKLITREGQVYKPFIKNKEPLKEELQHFIDCIKEKKEPITNGKIGVQIIKIIEACYESLNKKKIIKLK